MDEIQKLREALLTTGEVPSQFGKALQIQWRRVKEYQNAVSRFIKVVQESPGGEQLHDNISNEFSSDLDSEGEELTSGSNLSQQVSNESSRTGKTPLDITGSAEFDWSNIFGDTEKTQPQNTPQTEQGNTTPQSTPESVLTGNTYPSPTTLPNESPLPSSSENVDRGSGIPGVPPSNPTGPPSNERPGSSDTPGSILEKILEALLRIEKGGVGKEKEGKDKEEDKGEKEEDWASLFALATAESGLKASKLIRFVAARKVAHGAKKLGKRIGNWWGGKKTATPKTSTTPGAPSPGQPGAPPVNVPTGGGAATGEAAEAIGATEILAGAALFVGAVYEFGRWIYKFGQQREEAIRKQAEFGGQQAVGIAELDVGRIQRDIKTAGETGGSSKGLTASLDRFETVWQKIDSLLQNIYNKVGSELLDILTTIITPIASMAENLNDIADVLGKKDNNIADNLFGVKVDEAKDIRNMPHWPGGPVVDPNKVWPDNHPQMPKRGQI